MAPNYRWIVYIVYIFLFLWNHATRSSNLQLLRPKTGGTPIHKLWKEFCNTEVIKLKGCGPKTASCLEKMNIETVRDLLLHLPVSIKDRSHLNSLQSIQMGEYGTFEVSLKSCIDPVGNRPAKVLTTDILSGLPLDIVYFTMDIPGRKIAWWELKKTFVNGKKFWVHGRISTSKMTGKPELINPTFLNEALESKRDETFTIESQYPLSIGLKLSKLKVLIKSSLEIFNALLVQVEDRRDFEWVSEETLLNLSMPSLVEAIAQVHAPATEDELSACAPARRRLAFEELVSLYLKLKIIKENEVLDQQQAENNFTMPSHSIIPLNAGGGAFCLTVHNYTSEDLQRIKEYETEYVIVGDEVTEGGKSHLQIYFRTKNAITFSKIKQDFTTAHIEFAKGTDKQNKEYCSKQKVLYESGTPCEKRHDARLWSEIFRSKVLPYSLTSSQKKSLSEITEDLKEDHRMVRLLQGDVGSGKTVVSLNAMLDVVNARKIVLVLAPTEVLARQHYEIISSCFSGIQEFYEVNDIDESNGILPKVGIVTSSVKLDQRDRIEKGLQSGEYGVLVGTHALFQDRLYTFLVGLKNTIGLVVIDEEQRFGVNQRDKLAKLSNVLFTTATPIPRSLSLILQDSVAVSTIIDKPKVRRSIETVLLEDHLSQNVMKRVIANIPFGTKAIWVTPMISPTRNWDSDDSLTSSSSEVDADFKSSSTFGVSAFERYEEMCRLCPGKIGILHGKLDSMAKEEVIEKFRSGEINVLVSTTVIEVGLDIPDASICVVDQANRFGLSQLHQIRGRVGRGKAPVNEKLENAFCVLLYQKCRGEEFDDREYIAPEKLKILQDTSDGFRISEADLEMRGPGDFFGSKQHGISELKIASLTHHRDLLEMAKAVAVEIDTSSGCNSNPSTVSFLTEGLFPF